MSISTAKEDPKGPSVFENWKACQDGKPSLELAEFPLFSDSRVTGQELAEFRPYAFLNPVPDLDGRGHFKPVIFLQVEGYLEFEVPDMSSRHTESYHGGTLIDEIAALVSLALGIRVKAGRMSRRFTNVDPHGSPVAWIKQPEFLSVDHSRPKIPNAIGERPLSLLSPLSNIPLLSPEAANALIKAARSYQEALLASEENPNVGWLYFVAAIEKAASFWSVQETDKVAVIKELKGDLVKKLETFENHEEIIRVIADEIYSLVGSRKKFLGFLSEFVPGPPLVRPALFAQVNWEPTAMKKAFGVIYDHRCRALHEATPFPPIMCDSVWKEKEGAGSWHERPFAKGYASPGGSWTERDCPMFLNTFEYIVRKSLLSWWDSLIPTS